MTEFDRVLFRSILPLWSVFAVLLLIVVLMAIRKSRAAKNKTHRRLPDEVLGGIVCLVAVFVYALVMTAPRICDLRQDHYRSVHGEISYHDTNTKHDILVESDDGMHYRFEKPFFGGIDYPPAGSRGTVWYGEGSDFAVGCIPDGK